MKKTYPNRRQWIVEEKPLVSVVLDKIPFLAKPKWLKQELKWIVGEGQEVGMAANWEQQRESVVTHYRTTGSRKVKKMLSLIEEEQALYPECSEDVMDYHCVEVLVAALSPKATHCIQATYSDDTDIQEIIKERNQSAPFIVRLKSNEGFQYLLLVRERCCLIPRKE